MKVKCLEKCRWVVSAGGNVLEGFLSVLKSKFPSGAARGDLKIKGNGRIALQGYGVEDRGLVRVFSNLLGKSRKAREGQKCLNAQGIKSVHVKCMTAN